MENIDVRITQYPRKVVVSDFDIFLIADVSDVDVVTGFPKYKKVLAKDLPSIVNTAENITYAELLAQSVLGELVVGEFYNITDSTSGVAPILVQAISDSSIGYLAFDGDNPLVTINYDFITDTIRWSKDQTSEPVSLDSFSAVTPLSYDDTTGVFTISQSSAVNSGYLSATDWATFSAKQNALSGSGLVKSTSGTISYITDNSSNWNSAYNDTITSAAVTGTTSKLLTLTQRDGGTITASWGDLNSVTSVFGRTGAVVAESGDYTTTQVTEGTNLYYTENRFDTSFAAKTTSNLTEGTNLYYTDTRARASFSETVTGLTYTPLTGVLSTTAGYGIPTTASQTNWDTAYANRITSASLPLSITSNDISISQANVSINGYLSATDWNIFNSKQPAGNYITALTGEATASGPNSASVTLSNSAVIGKILTGLNVTGGSISASDSILNAFGKVQNQINGLIGGTIYKGTWNAATNSPNLTSGVGTQGWYYIVSVAGSTNLDGITDWNLGDWAIFDGTAWQQVDNTDAVISVNGQVGIVNLTTTNIGEGTNLYYTDVRVSANSDVSANTAARHNAVTLGTANGLSLATQQLSLALSSASANGALSSTDWSTFSGKQNALSGTGIVKSVSGTISYLTDNSANWDSAYNNSIVSAGVTGTTTKTLTLNQQDGGTITASWTDDNTDAVSSVFGRTGAVIAVSGDYTTTQVTEGTNLYYTEGRVDANSNVAANTAARHNAVTIGTANGLSLSTQQISLGLSSGTTTGALSSTDWTTFNSKQNALGFTPEPAITAGTTAQYWRGDKSFQTLDTSVVPENTNLYYTSARFDTAFGTKTTTNLTEGTNLYFTDSRARAAITLTTTGTSGPSTYVGGTLNIPDYSSALSGYLPLSGGTLTGDLFGTNATFTGVVSVKGAAPYYQWINASNTRLAYIQHNGSDLLIATDTGDIVLNPNGKVGIKTSTPSENLTVGDGTATGSQYVRINASASDIYIGQSGGTLFGQSANSAGFVLSDNVSFPFAVGTIAAQDFILGTNNTVRFTINGSTGAITATSSITASSFVKSGGTSSQALLADGSVGTFSASNWNTAYNDSIVSAAVTGTSTKLLTLNQQDGGTITASWSESSAPVVSVFGRTGAILAAEGDYSLTQLSDVTITTPSNGQVLKYNGTAWINGTDTDTGLTSVGLSMPSAFTVTNSPLTANGTLAVTGAGTTLQYVRGDGSLATFPTVASEAQRLITEVYNETGATLTKGTVVYINGGHGNLPTVTKALATSDATSAQTYGVVQNNITDNNNGFVVVIGSIIDVPTNTYLNGTILYLSPTTAGEWTSTKPYAPQHLVYVGIVTRSHPTQGVVEIRVQNGYEMDELHNVSAQSPSNGDILQYVSSTSLWTKTAGTTTNIAEGTNLYYTSARFDSAFATKTTTNLTEGTNLYYTAARFNTAFSGKTTTDLTEGTNLYYTAARFNTAFSGKSTTDLAEGTNLYFTDARARAAISLTTTGSSGVATYSGGVLNIPNYGSALANYLPLSGGTMTGIITTVSTGTAINFSGQTDSFGYNVSSGLGTYIKGTGNTFIYGGGIFYDGAASRTLLHSGNYNSYAPTLTGTGASGSWGISITGNAATADNSTTTSQRNFSGDISTTGMGRFTGWYNGNAATGLAAEIGISAGQAYIIAYNRGTNNYGTLNFESSAANLQIVGSVVNVTTGSLQQGGNQVLHAGNVGTYAVKTLATISGNIDSDYGECFVTFDPIPSGTPPLSSPNIRTINVGNSYSRRTQLAFDYASDTAFFRRRTEAGWFTWREFIHSGNIGSQSVNYATTAGSASSVAWGNISGIPNEIFNYDGWVTNPGYDANTIAGNKSGFTYANNAPYVGPLTHFAASGYGLQFNASYSGGGTLISYRTRNGDTSTWNSWFTLITSANIASQSVSSAVTLTSTQFNWNSTGVISNVIGMLAWKNYGNNHVIFDASQGTSPSGGAVSQTNSANAWTASFPTLMGWNGATTYGVRVDSARVADSASSATYANAVYLGGNSNFSITDNSWAGAVGYHGYSYTGGNFRFGFSSTGGYIDVYTDGNFYAGIDLNGSNNLVLHTGNFSTYALPLTGGTLTGNLTISRSAADVFLKFTNGTNNFGWNLTTTNKFRLYDYANDIVIFNIDPATTTSSFYYSNFEINSSATSGGSLIFKAATAANTWAINKDNTTGLSITKNSVQQFGISATGVATFASTIISTTGDILGGSAASDYGSLTLRGGYGATTAQASYIQIRGYEGGVATQGALMFYTNNTERLRISQTGAAVFYGLLSVVSNYISVGAYGLSSDTYSGSYIRTNGTSSYGTWSIDGAKGGYTGLLFNVTNAPHMMFNSTGSGGIYYQTGGRWVMYYDYTNNCTSIGSSASSASYRLLITGDSRVVGSFNVSTLTTNGIVYSNGGTLTNTNPSDIRLKENIKPLEYGLNEIMALNPVKFKWKDGSNNGEEQVGLIAQNVQEVMPDLVKNISEDSDLLGLDSYAINIVLINAIKELQARIQILENK